MGIVYPSFHRAISANIHTEPFVAKGGEFRWFLCLCPPRRFLSFCLSSATRTPNSATTSRRNCRSELSALAATSLAVVVVRLVAAPPPPFHLRFPFFSCFFFFYLFFLAASSSLFSSAHFETNLSSGAPFSTHFHTVFSRRLALVFSHNNPQSVDLMDSISCPLPLSMS